MAYSREITLHLQLARRWGWRNGASLRLVTATLDEPTKRVPDSVVVKVRVLVPDEAFDPVYASTIDVPLSAIERPVVEVGG